MNARDHFRVSKTPPAAAGRGVDTWRERFANLWTELASIRADGCARGYLDGDALAWARAVLGGSANLLAAVGEASPTDPDWGLMDEREECLWCAASALEASAAVWHECGPAAGSRRRHLVRRLERRLEEYDRDIVNGIASNRPTRKRVMRVSRSALWAIDRLDRAKGNRAELLDEIEDGAVEIAALAVQAELGKRRPGQGEASVDVPRALEDGLVALTGEAVETGRGVARHDTISLLCLAVEKRPSRADLEAVTAAAFDRSLRAESLLAIRRFWLELGGVELAALGAIGRELADGGGADSEAIRRRAARYAARLLIETGLATRWGELDMELALDYQRSGLLRAIRSYVGGLREARPQRFRRSQRVLEKRLARVLMVVWAIDQHLGAGSHHNFGGKIR